MLKITTESKKVSRLMNQNKERDLKLEEQDKCRCARYLLDMFIKYGPVVRAEEKKKTDN